MKYLNLFLLFMLLPLSLCTPKLTTMKYDKVFQVNLGTEPNQLGSNLPILDSFTNRRGLPSSLLLDVPLPRIEGGKVYFADTYNKKVNIYTMDGKLHLSIPNSNQQYQFARPYHVYVDKTESIYVAASEKDSEPFEVQHYSNQNMKEKEYNDFNRSLSSISAYNYYIYKFSSRGEFINRIGFTSGDPMPLPAKIEGDNLGNIYVHFSEDTFGDSIARILLRRYSRSGELNFEFTTRTIRIETNVGSVNYKGNVVSVNNLINDEQLLVMVEFQPTTNARGEAVPTDIDNVFSSLYVYSILENNFTRQVGSFRGITPGVLGTDDRGRVFYENYDEETDTLRIIVASALKEIQTAETNYVPLNSSYYTLFPYFINTQGSIYNLIVDRNSACSILEWKKR